MTTNVKKTNGVHGDDLVNFEKGRIKALQEERLHIQKKTFTKWMNSFLLKVRMEVEDLFKDLADGKKLLKLLEIISNEKLGKPNNGKMRVHHVENVNKSLAFLHTKVRLESIGAEDIVDGNPRLILGLIWTIILRFQIQEIEIDVDEDNHESSEKKSAKDALLLWCQRKTNGYPNVNIVDFTSSWRSGLGFNALIHAHRPDVINYSALVPTKHIDNLNNAFDTAENELGIPRLLDAEDIDCQKPDEKSVLTYVASYYHTFARMKNELKGGRRIANIITQIMEAEDLKETYETTTTTLLTWIRETTRNFETKNLPNEINLVKGELSKFKEYRTVEKPPKYKEKSEIEASYFNINIRLKSLNQAQYTPPEGKLLYDIERSWLLLEKAENRLESRLKNELIRQTQLEQVAFKFGKKSDLRSGYLKDMIQVLSDKRYGVNLGQVEATLKKHEAISADILAREERCKQLKSMSDYLWEEGFHGKVEIRNKATVIMETWDALLALLNKHKINLTKFNDINQIEKEAENLAQEIDSFSFDKMGSQLIEVEDLLQKLELNEVTIANLGEVLKKLNRQGCQGDEAVARKLKQVGEKYEKLVRDGKEYRSKLEEKLGYFKLLGDLDEEMDWVEDKLITLGVKFGKDLRGLERERMKLKTLNIELKQRAEHHHQRLFEQSLDYSIETTNLSTKLKQLTHELKQREEKLKTMETLHQYLQDCNEIRDWINEKRPLVESQDYGQDVPSATSLLQRHRDLVIEIASFRGDVEGLGRMQVQDFDDESSDSEWTQEQRLVPQEYFSEEEIEKQEYKTVTEERAVPQVKALYPFTGQDNIEMVKGEVMFLLNKTNGDWWNVRKATGQDGFVPANYVKEIEPKVVMVQVRKPETVKETKRVKKTKMVMQSFNKKVAKVTTGKNEKSLEGRIREVVKEYGEIVAMGEERTKNLQNSIKLLNFFAECDDFEKWLQTKQSQLDNNDPSESIETAKKKFDKLFTDLSASTKRLENIDAMAAELKTDKVKQRQKQVHKLYDELNRLKAMKEKSLEGASSVELFYRNCGELEEWILEKSNQIDDEQVFLDLKTLEGLQRRHDGVERELAPIREKLSLIHSLANDVTATYPREKPNATKKLTHLQSLWSKLTQKAADRRNLLQTLVGKEIFQNSFKSLQLFTQSMETQIDNNVPIKDVQTAEDELKKHEQLLDEIKNKDFQQIIDLGASLLKIDPKLESSVSDLKHMQNSLPLKWQAKQDRLQQQLDLQMFEKEADAIDRQVREPDTTQATNLEQVQLFLKQHQDYENRLNAMDERLATFTKMAEQLESVHPETAKISQRKQSVQAKRDEIKVKSKTRKDSLQKQHRFYQFATDIHDMVAWVQEKTALATSDDYRDLQNIQKKLKAHQVFAGELRANESKLKQLNRTGQKLVQDQNNIVQVEQLLHDLNSQWKNLADLCSEKLVKLRQAEQQQNFNKDVDSMLVKLSEIGSDLASKDLGKDRRACKELLKKHELTENELANCQKKINELAALGRELKNEGHFDGDAILGKAAELQDKIDKLKEPMDKRRRALEELLKFYDFLYEIDNELGYIEEKKSILSAMQLPNDLHEANLKVKKLEKFEKELVQHEGLIEKVLQQGTGMSQHAEHKKIKAACDNLKEKWQLLLDKSQEKKQRLDLSLKTHQYYNDALEVETWIHEKQNLLNSSDYGKDKEQSVKLLTNHKTIELEIDTFQALVKEIGRLISKSNPDFKEMLKKQQVIEQLMENLKEKANARRNKLIETMNKHEFYIESGEFLNWIEDKIQICSSEEYGVDFEHLEGIRGKFEQVKMEVNGAEGRLKSIEDVFDRLKSVDQEEVGRIGSVEQVHELLWSRWNFLLQTMEARDMKLLAAGEIHRFNRDVADALERINEKLNEIPEELGKDYNSCESLLRNLENFENDLVPLEAQLQVLIDDSTRLSNLYPTNAPNIQEEQQLVIKNWTDLQNRTESKKLELQSTLDYYKFLSLYNNLTNWANNLLKQLERLEQKGDAFLLMQDHERVKSEIASRQDKYKEIEQLSLLEREDIDPKLTHLKQQKEQLNVAWMKKKIFLDQLIDLQIFLRDSKALQSLINHQETIVNQPDSSSTVEEVEKSLKKHGEMENLIQKQQHKFDMQEGKKLVQQGHFETKKVQEIIQEIANKRLKLVQLAEKKRSSLKDKLNYLKFVRDVEESLIYIDEKEKQLENLNKDTQNLEEKIKKLKKHQAFEAELKTSNVNDVIKQAKSIDPNLHKKLHSKWTTLLQMSQEIGKGLEEAQDILDFQNEVEKLEQWMREREALVQVSDLGKDFEHCEELIKRLELDKVDDSRINKINELGKKIQTKSLDRLNRRWNELKDGLHSYRKKLEEAIKVHAFNKEVDELDLRIKEKIPSVSVEDVGRDLDSVEALLRKQDQIENQMRLIESKLKELSTSESILSKTHPVTIQKVTDSWSKLSELCFKRRQDLTDSHSLQKFLKKVTELENFVETNVAKLKNARLPSNLTQAEELLEEQRAVREELALKGTQFFQIEKEMSRLIVEGHQYSDELKKCIQLVGKLREKLDTAVLNRDTLLDQGVKLQAFNKQATETENVLNELESTCKYYLGDELSFILKMIKVHGESGNLLLKKATLKTNELEQFASELINQQHYESVKIESKSNELKSRLEQLKNQYQQKTKTLLDSRDYQKFLETLNQVIIWLKEKHQIASDDNYSDMTNLQSKMQKHQAFESEITAFESKKSNQILQQGHLLIQQGNIHKDKINEEMSQLVQLSSELKAASNNKRDRLYESYQALLFFNNLDDLEQFLDEPNFEEKSENLTQCKYLLKKWSLLKENYDSKQELKENFQKKLDSFSSHFMKDEIHARVKHVFEKFDQFSLKLSTKLEQLLIDLANYEYSRDVGELKELIQEKLQQIKSLDDGTSVLEVVQLLKKLDSIEQELNSNQKKIEKLSDMELNNMHSNLMQEIQKKRLRLNQSLKSQEYYAKLNEAKFYIKEKQGVFASGDYGSDEESVQKLVKKFDTNYSNLTQFQVQFNQICSSAEELNSNFDHEKIQESLKQVKQQFSELQKLADKRKQRLSDAEKLFKFQRESDELIEWIEAQMNIAGSEDYGRDVEHVEILIQKFDSFLQSVLNTGENRVEHSNQVVRELQEERHPEVERILQKSAQVKSTWDDFKELATARSDALEGAKRVHMFDRSADETISWINEKLFILSEKMGQDLTVEEKALSERVLLVKSDAQELGQLFPDAEEHVECKLDECLQVWDIFLMKIKERKEKEVAMAAIKEYFDEYDALIGYIVELGGRLSSIGLVEGVEQAEYQLDKFNEVKSEFVSREIEFDKFQTAGEGLIQEKHFLSMEIEQKLTNLKEKRCNIETFFQQRHQMLEQNLDLQKFHRDLNNFESLLKAKQSDVSVDKEIESISQVEELLRQFEDVEIFVDLIGGKLGVVERRTLIEQMVDMVKSKEKCLKEEEIKRLKAEQKIKEMERIRGERQVGSNSGSSWFSDIMRRGSDPINLSHDIPRSSSFRTPQQQEKKPKRTPSFTTRRRTQSFRKVTQPPPESNLPPITIDSYLERKHELLSGAKRSSSRSWKSFYTVLCGQLLCFFKEQQDFVESRPAACSPVNVCNSLVEEASDYLKRKFVFRLKCFDGSEYLFACEGREGMEEWVKKISMVSKLEPREQFMIGVVNNSEHGHDGDQSSSDDEISVKLKPRSREPLYCNLEKIGNSLEEEQKLRNKPPIPPRSSSINKIENEVRGEQRQNINPYHHVYQATNTLPPKKTSPQHGDNNQPRSSGSLPTTATATTQHHHDSSSESDSPKSGKNPKRSSTGLLGLFKRKRATQL